MKILTGIAALIFLALSPFAQAKASSGDSKPSFDGAHTQFECDSEDQLLKVFVGNPENIESCDTRIALWQGSEAGHLEFKGEEKATLSAKEDSHGITLTVKSSPKNLVVDDVPKFAMMYVLGHYGRKEVRCKVIGNFLQALVEKKICQ